MIVENKDILNAYRTQCFREFSEHGSSIADRNRLKELMLQNLKKLNLKMLPQGDALTNEIKTLATVKIPFEFLNDPKNRDNEISNAIGNLSISIEEFISNIVKVFPDLNQKPLNDLISENPMLLKRILQIINSVTEEHLG